MSRINNKPSNRNVTPPKNKKQIDIYTRTYASPEPRTTGHGSPSKLSKQQRSANINKDLMMFTKTSDTVN